MPFERWLSFEVMAVIEVYEVYVYSLYSGFPVKSRKFKSEKSAREYAHQQRMSGYAAVATKSV